MEVNEVIEMVNGRVALVRVVGGTSNEVSNNLRNLYINYNKKTSILFPY